MDATGEGRNVMRRPSSRVPCLDRCWRRALRAALAAFALLWLPHAAGAGDFEVRTASLGVSDGAWRLSARIDYRLTDEVRAALESGVPLSFRVEIQVDRVRRWLPDATVLETAREWQLTFEPLSRRYVVRYPDEREATTHATSFGALNAIGRVQGLAVAEAAAFDCEDSCNVAVRASLSRQTLPEPLQFLAFWNGGFALESDWYEWTIPR